MVVETQRNNATWYECETCGLLFDNEIEATEHESNCDQTGPTYLQ